jgi:hypothetical protein
MARGGSIAVATRGEKQRNNSLGRAWPNPPSTDGPNVPLTPPAPAPCLNRTKEDAAVGPAVKRKGAFCAI